MTLPRTAARLAALTAVIAMAVPTAAVADEPPAAETVDAPLEQAPDDFSPAGPAAPVVTPVGDAEEARQRQVAALATPIVLAGRGNGHGIGLSQYGTQGQALVGRTTEQILSHYYAGSRVATSRVDFDPRIGVTLDAKKVRLTVRGGPARISYGGTTVTSPDGESWDVLVTNSGRQCWIDMPGGGGTGFAAVDGEPCLVADPVANDATARIDVQVPSGSGWRREGQYGRAAVVEVVADDRSSASTTNWRVDVVVETTMDQYIYGLAEMPYSWEPAALRAQAIAGRSYALWRLKAVGPSPDRGCSCHLYDSQQDQVFKGWDREQSALWDRWRAAVDATSDRVVSAPGAVGTQGGVVQAFYSSSSNGRTEAKHELWGGTPYPYLVSVADPWALAPATRNPHASWQKELARGTVAARVGLDQLTAVEVAARSASGAATEVRFVGTDAGASAAVTASGSWVRLAFGLRSTTFEATAGNLFTDTGASPHAADIAWLAEAGITYGCNDERTLFCPDGTVTRGQMAAFIARALDLPAGTRTFSDTRGHLFEAHVASLADAGITYGCNPPSNTRFCPDAPVSRGEMAAFIARATSLPMGPATSFDDATGHLHTRAIEAVRRAGITVGCNPPANTRFCPDAPVTRAQMASFLRRTMEG